MIDSDAERSTDSILTTITLADGILLLVLAVEIELEVLHYLLCELRQTVFLHERKHCCLDRCERSRDAEHNAGLTVLQCLLLVGMAEHCQNHTVHSDGGLDYIWSISPVLLRVEVFDFLS